MFRKKPEYLIIRSGRDELLLIKRHDSHAGDRYRIIAPAKYSDKLFTISGLEVSHGPMDMKKLKFDDEKEALEYYLNTPEGMSNAL